MKLVKQIGLAAIVLSLSGITGCGDMGGMMGGGQGAGGTAPSGGGTAGGAAPAGGTCSGRISSCHSGYSSTLLSEINSARTSNLSIDGKLENAANKWAQEMAKCKSLKRYSGTYGYAYKSIAGTSGTGDLSQIAEQWSLGAHAKNNAYVHAGFGCAKGEDGENYWAGIYAQPQ